jgi:hypothetical protein
VLNDDELMKTLIGDKWHGDVLLKQKGTDEGQVCELH